MEGGSGHDRSKEASDEVESAANNDDTAASSARSYECIFCKRGFSTAQALGGHMNIHRRDRMRTAKAGPSAARRAELDGDVGGHYHPYNPTHRRSTSVGSASATGYAVYLPEAAAVANRPSDENTSRATRELSLFGDDLHLRMSVHGEHATTTEDQEKIGGGEEDEGKLDLELRLGNNKQ